MELLFAIKSFGQSVNIGQFAPIIYTAGVLVGLSVIASLRSLLKSDR